MAIKKRQQLDESESEQEEEYGYTYANDSQDEDVNFMYNCMIGSLTNYFFFYQDEELEQSEDEQEEESDEEDDQEYKAAQLAKIKRGKFHHSNQKLHHCQEAKLSFV